MEVFLAYSGNSLYRLGMVFSMRSTPLRWMMAIVINNGLTLAARE